MKTNRFSIPSLILALGLTLLPGLRSASAESGTFEVYGAEVVSTTAPLDAVAAARNEVHRTFAHWIKDHAGRDSDPTFSEGGQSWTQSKPGQPDNVAVARGKTEFTDAQGHHIKIEVISAKNAPTLVFFSHEGAADRTAILNAFLSSLQKQGVKNADVP